MNAAMVVGLNLLIGYAGQISLGHAGFFGLGAYASAILTSRYGWPPLAAMLAAMAGVGVIAFVVARPILKLKGHYLAMATLGLGIIIYMVLVNESALTGGNDGMQVPPFSVLGATLPNERAWYWATGAVLIAAIWIAENIVDSPLGRALRALHGSEVAAQMAGVDTTSYKVRVFVVSALYASVVGSMMAHYVGFITPQVSGFFHSIELVTMVVVGGMASTYGAVVGAAILTMLPQFLSRFEGYEMIAFGAILMLTMIFLPRGLLPTIAARLKRQAG
ncbi:MAG: branched-chain amino acid ABC transporter permease [Betaproteobacteria bacterium]|nr:branched-chain amino acid ABC transporter permease [Betaproteobacteria bacterium]